MSRSDFDGLTRVRRLPQRGTRDRAEAVTHPDDKVAALRCLTEHVTPGRWAEVRWPTAAELQATTVLRLPLEHATAKIRAAGVGDDETDLDLPVWAGIVPMATAYGTPVPSPDLVDGLSAPWSVATATTSEGVPAAVTGAGRA